MQIFFVKIYFIFPEKSALTQQVDLPQLGDVYEYFRPLQNNKEDFFEKVQTCQNLIRNVWLSSKLQQYKNNHS